MQKRREQAPRFREAGATCSHRALCGRGQPPYRFVRYFQKSKKFYLLIVILSERTDASRRISPAQSKRGRGVYAPSSCIKCYFTCMELQRFYLDPATASPCGLLVCFAAPRKLRCPRSASAPTHRLRWSRLRATPCAQDDTDGMKSRISGERSSPLRVCTLI